VHRSGSGRLGRGWRRVQVDASRTWAVCCARQRGRFPGVYASCIRNLRGEPPDGGDDLVDLVRLRLDLVGGRPAVAERRAAGRWWCGAAQRAGRRRAGLVPGEFGPRAPWPRRTSTSPSSWRISRRSSRAALGRPATSRPRDGRAILVHVGGQERGGRPRSPRGRREHARSLRELGAKPQGSRLSTRSSRCVTRIDPKHVPSARAKPRGTSVRTSHRARRERSRLRPRSLSPGAGERDDREANGPKSRRPAAS